MPVLCFKKKVKINNCFEIISFAFNCIYDNNYCLKLNDCSSNNFDSGDFRVKIDETIKNLNGEILLEYERKNNGVWHMALLNYFYDNIPGLYSIKFESESGDSIYYVSELKSE